MNPANALNFSGGPGALPEAVLEQVKESIVSVPGVGLSILGISHRSEWYASVVAELETHIRELLNLPVGYSVLFLQGGATQQFSMLPMTLLRGSTHAADYLHTGYWSGKALPEARREGPVRVVWSGSDDDFARLPTDAELIWSEHAPYMHYVSNETVEGLQFHRLLGRDDVPRVCDMSSDFLSRPVEGSDYAMIYAHAQKNLGPAGVTVVVLKDSLLDHARENLPGFLDYRAHSRTHSIYNTPPVFAVYVVLLVVRWLRETIGGLAAMAERNAAKAATLYTALDASNDFYRGLAAVPDRSLMNVTFTLPTPELHAAFLDEAARAGFSGLGGHRSVGGIRASLYNGLEQAAVDQLTDFMDSFRRARR